MGRRRKPRLSQKKGAASHGGGKRQSSKAPAVLTDQKSDDSVRSSGSDSDDSEHRVSSVPKAAKQSAAASPRATSRASTPPAQYAAAATAELEKELRKAKKTLREIDALMYKDVATLNHDQKAKLLRYNSVALEIEALEVALLAMLQEPEDAEAEDLSQGDAGSDEDADAGAEAAAAAAAARYRDDADSSSEAGSSSSDAHSRLSLASVISAAAHEPSEYYEEPAPPTPPQPPPALRRSDVAAAGSSTEDAYAERERWARQLQATYRRKLAQRRRRAREAASQAATDHTLRTAMAARPGWTVMSIPHTLQSDGFQCAPWTHVALGLFAAYFKAGVFGGFGQSFTQHTQLRPLDLLTERGRQAMQRAKAVNSAFIQGVRDEMRQQLRDADATGALSFKPIATVAAPVSPRSRQNLQAQGGSIADAIDAM